MHGDATRRLVGGLNRAGTSVVQCRRDMSAQECWSGLEQDLVWFSVGTGDAGSGVFVRDLNMAGPSLGCRSKMWAQECLSA